MDRRTELRRERDMELEDMAEKALDRADEAFGKWETHEQVCAERYKRLDGTMDRFGETLDKVVKIGLGILLAFAGTIAVRLLDVVSLGAG